MAEEAARSRLGRGLAALMGDVRTETSVERPRGQRRLPTGALRPNARNPRRAFADAELEELAASVRERGIIQPIIVRPLRGVDDEFEIIAGERRWRAAQRAALHEVPVVVIEATDAEALQLAIIENVQRADLNALEEAEGYRALIDEFDNSQDEIARIVGKSRSHVANTLRLLKLSDAVKAHIRSGKLSCRARAHAHRRAGRRRAGRRDRRPRPQRPSGRGDRARARAEERARKREWPRSAQVGGEKRRHAGARKAVSDATGLVVSIDHHDEHGTLTIRYRSLDQLDDLVQRLVRGH